MVKTLLWKYLENFSRGWFSGNVGIIRNLNEGCFVIAIRSALIKNITATLFAGAGIVKNSIPDQEFDETQLKLKTILDAIKISLWKYPQISITLFLIYSLII